MKTPRHAAAYLFLSGILTSGNLIFGSPVLSLVCLVPLLLVLFRSGKLSFSQSVLFAVTNALFLFSWMIGGAGRFTGNGLLYGIGAFLFSALFFSAYWGGATWLWARSSQKAVKQPLLAALFLSAGWALAEEVFFLFIPNLPWFSFRVGHGLSNNIFALQYASLGGAGLISFLAVLLNVFIAQALAQKAYRLVWKPVVAAAAIALGGWLMLFSFEKAGKPEGSFKAVIPTQNLAPEEKWNEANGNALAKQLIGLGQTAATHQPPLIVWSECVLPWTYDPGDDLTKELLKTAPGAAHLLGMNTAADADRVYNSTYYFDPTGKQAAVYHKQQPLFFVEKPALGVLLPFLSSGGFNVKEGTNSSVIATAVGKAGVMICNESIIASLGRKAVQNGAQFLVNSSNDGWISGSYLAEAHWLQARLRAVETRRDILVNSNKGYSGIIYASGKTGEAVKSDEPIVTPVQVSLNSSITHWVRLPFLFPVLYMSIVILSYTISLHIAKKAIAK